jgi:hypothetical protein
LFLNGVGGGGVGKETIGALNLGRILEKKFVVCYLLLVKKTGASFSMLT